MSKPSAPRSSAFHFHGAAPGRCLVAFSMALLAAITAPAASEDDADRASREPPGSLEFVGENLFSTAEGSFHEWRLVESRFDAASPDASYAVVEVRLASVDTGNDRRDDHLRTADFFDVETHPTARARGHSLVAKGESEAGHRLYAAQFDIDLHGVQRTVPGEIEVVAADPPVVEGRLEIDRLEFEIGPPVSRWNPLSIKARIPVSFRIELD